MVHSNIVYCINVYFAYGCANNSALKPLILKQKQAIRTISNAGYRDHMAPLFAQHKFLPVNELIQYSKIKFMHNYICGNLPPSFFDLWQTNRERNALHKLRNADDLYIPPHRTDLYKRMPLVSFPTAWNTIDNRKFNPR